MPPLSDSLQRVTTFQEFQSLLEKTDPSLLDARLHRTALRDSLGACGARIAEVRQVIARYLFQAADATPKSIDGLAADFRRSILALMPEEEGSTDDLPAITKVLNARPEDLLGHSEEAVRTQAILEHPEEDEPLLVFSDWLEEHDPHGLPRAELIRCEHELRLHPPVERRQAVQEELHHLQYEHLKQTFARSQLPWPKDWRWDRSEKQERRESFPERAIAAFKTAEIARQVEILQTLLRLPEQWAGQHRLLRTAKLLERSPKGQEGITGVDGRWHPVPTFTASNDPNGYSLLGQLYECSQQQRTLLFTKALQGFDTLEIVPFALPLDRFVEAWREGLLRNEQHLQPFGGLDRQNPVWVWEQYTREELVYHPREFTADHGARTKVQLLAVGHPRWNILLVEGNMTDIPREGQGSTIAGRQQIECNQTPSDSLSALLADEVGWTPESYICRFLAAMEQRGQVLDAETHTYLIDTFFRSNHRVPGACWAPGFHRGYLGRWYSGAYDGGFGARAAVRVV